MRLLVDQDIYKISIDNLREWGHDVLTAKELGLQQASDQDLLKRAQAEKRLLLTRDKGFGAPCAFLLSYRSVDGRQFISITKPGKTRGSHGEELEIKSALFAWD